MLPTPEHTPEHAPGHALQVVCFGTPEQLGQMRVAPSVQITRQGRSVSADMQSISLPRPVCNLKDEIAAGGMIDWMPVVCWLRDRIGHHAILLVHFDDPLRELFVFAASAGLFNYAVFLPEAPGRVRPEDYPVLTSARSLVFSGPDAEAAFRPLYPPFYKGCLLQDGAGAIAPGPLADTGPDCAGMPAPTLQPDPTLRILLVGYFSGPARAVGVKRINHWYARIPEFLPGAQVDVATAIPWDTAPDNVHVIPDPGPAALLNADGSAFDWAVDFIETESHDARFFATMSHYWRIAIERYFEDRPEQYDVVLLSGNPFSVFDFASFAKRKWYASVILDYRDPFANNPRIGFSPEGREWARYVERGYNFQADLVTVVNDDCVPMVEAREDVPVVIIPNGYDERDLVAPSPRLSREDGRIHFVHAGSILHDRSPKALLGAMQPDRHILHHVGNVTGLDAEDQAQPHLNLYGMLTYDDVMRRVSAADCGIVFTSETGFETPTKLYDYLAYGLDVLIVTHGPLRHGAVHLALGDLEGVYWASNTPEGLEGFIREYVPSPERRAVQDRERFSRANSLHKLLQEIRRHCQADPAHVVGQAAG